jgi:toluene monooxygenase system protein E
LRAQDWEQFRDPDALTYRGYVTLQSDAETHAAGVLEQYAEAGADAALRPGQLALLGALYTPSRYLVHGCQQIQAYIGYMAPTSYVTNACGFATADFLRRVTLTAYRTRELQLAHPGSEIGERERRIWEDEPAWQPAREAIERALVAYDWGEAFTALDLVLAPTLDDVLVRQFAEVSRANGDEQSWLLGRSIQADNDRRDRWVGALVQFCLRQCPENVTPLRKWIAKWSPLADAAALGLGQLLERLPEQGLSAVDVAEQARTARNAFHARLFAEPGTSSEPPHKSTSDRLRAV